MGSDKGIRLSQGPKGEWGKETSERRGVNLTRID